MIEWLQDVGAVAGVLSLIVLLFTVDQAMRSSVIHVRAHIDLIRPWAIGDPNDPKGWPPGKTSIIHRFLWMMPSRIIHPQSSAPAISQLGLVQGIFLDNDLIVALADVAQEIEKINSAVATYQAFKSSDVQTYVRVAMKLDSFVKRVRAEKLLPVGATADEQLNWALEQAGISGFEADWCYVIDAQQRDIHEYMIGDEHGTGLHAKYLELVKVFDRCYGGLAWVNARR